MAKQLPIYWTIKCLLSLVLLGVATGTGNTPHAEESPNYAMLVKEKDQTRRDGQMEQTSNALAPAGAVEDGTRHQSIFGPLEEPKKVVKRAPSGFTGMRGKKEYEFTDLSSDDVDWDNGPLLEHEDIEDEDFEYTGKPNGRRFKKAPTAFYGVRGKKYSSSTGGDLNRLNEFLQKLEEERLRGQLLQDFIDRVALSTISQNEISKRAPTGFTGMRGKRPTTAFYADDNDEDELDSAAAMEKRAPSLGFVGVRGKKDVDHQNYKRSPTDSFMNGRGKNPRFGDFTNKFVAVRGKKAGGSESDSWSSSNSAQLVASSPPNQQLQQRVRGKRAASASVKLQTENE